MSFRAEGGSEEPRSWRSFTLLSIIGALALGSALIISAEFLRDSFSASSSNKSPFQKIKVALLNSEYSHSWFRQVGGNYATITAQWERLLQELITEERISFKRVSDSELEKGLKGYDLLILPSATALSDRELENITAFVERGGGVLISWAVGARSPDGAWRGWQFISKLAGIEVVGTDLESKGRTIASVILGDSPLSAGLAAGERLKILPRSELFLVQANRSDAYWGHLPEEVSQAEEYLRRNKARSIPSASASRNLIKKGRVVFFAFSLDWVVQSPDQQRLLKRLVANSLNWLAQRPIAMLKTWPGRYPAAAVFALNGEGQQPTALKSIEIFQKKGVKGTFFILPNQARLHPDLVIKAKTAGEIALFAESYGDFGNLPYKEQLARLSQGKEILSEFSGQEVTGLGPVYLGGDQTIIRAASGLGLKYLVAWGVPSSAPRVIQHPDTQINGRETLPGKKFVLFPQPFTDDYELFVKLNLSPYQALAIWNGQLLWAVREQSLFMLAYSTASPWGLLSGKEWILEELISNAVKNNLWIATASEVADWWMARENVSIKTRAAKGDRFLIAVTNNNSINLPEIQAYYFLPESFTDVKVAANKSYRQKIAHYYIKEERKLVIALKDMMPGEQRTLQVEKDSGGE